MCNLIQPNTGKTELNIFGTRQMLLILENTNFNISGDTIDVTSCTKNFGVIFDYTLSVKYHRTIGIFFEIKAISVFIAKPPELH